MIVQEPGEKCPDDNVGGGVIEFEFDPPAEYVKNIGLLDVDYATMIQISYIDENGKVKNSNIIVPVLGDNSYQLLSLAEKEVTGPVTKLSVIMSRSAGISSTTFCVPPGPAPMPSMPPTPGTCVNAEIDFNELPDGTKLAGGDYLDMQYKPFYGIEFSAFGGLRDMFRVFSILPRLEMLLMVILIWDHQIRNAQEEDPASGKEVPQERTERIPSRIVITLETC